MRPRNAFAALILLFAILAAVPVHPQFRGVSRKAAAVNQAAKPLRITTAKRGSVPNQLIIKLAPNADANSMAALHRRTGARVLSEIPQLRTQTIQLPNAKSADAYRNHALVRWAAPNHYRGPLVANPDDFYYSAIDTNTDM